MKKQYLLLVFMALLGVSASLRTYTQDSYHFRITSTITQAISTIKTFFGFPAAISQTYQVTPSCKLIIEKGDIIACASQAIVNAANTELQGGAGVCGAIFTAAGWNKLQMACNQNSAIDGIRCPTGTVYVTESFDLKARGIKTIIHAVGPDCRIITDTHEQDRLLADAYTNSLLAANFHKINSVAFPFISSAIYAFPKERAAEIALKTVIEYAKNNKTTLNFIKFVLHSQEDFDLFCMTIKKKLYERK